VSLPNAGNALDTGGVTDRGRDEPSPNENRRPVVVAVTADDDRYAETRRAAMDIAGRDSAKLLLYDWDAATVLGNPLPSWWSGEGAAEDVPSELDEAALQAAGRSAIADQVAQARAKGIDAAAWLPSKPGGEALAEYAQQHGATTIVLPEDLQATSGLERLVESTDDPERDVEEASRARVVVVPARPEA
jgi:hypothetical protein